MNDSDDGLLLVLKNDREAKVAEKLGFQATSDRDALGKWTEVLRDGLIAITKSSVKLIELPSSRSLSGWVDAGGTRTELLRIIAEAPNWAPQEIDNFAIIPTPDEDERDSPERIWPKWPYLVRDGRICWGKKTIVGPEIQSLCNFNATIIEDSIRDDGSDGAQAARTYKLEGKLSTGEQLPTAFVPAGEFRSMNWVDKQWGAKANISAGNNSRDKLREAVKELSDPVERRTYCHTGWRKFDGNWFYLLHGGAVGAAGFTSAIDVDLGELRAYSWHALPALSPEDLREAMEESLRLLGVGLLRVTAPLWAAMFRAPLETMLSPAPYTCWVEAPTGRLKSTLSALFLCHFGNFDTNRLPGSWRSTANSLEKSAHVLKDAPFVIDDYSHNDRALHARAAEFCRAQGNKSGRGRLKPSIDGRPSFPPRGIAISTGELHPSGDPGDRSLQARVPIIAVPPNAIDIKLLTASQTRTNVLLRAMAGYVQWLAGLVDDGELPPKKDFRDALPSTTAGEGQLLLRMSEALGNLWRGIEWGFRYAQRVGAITDEDAAKLRVRCLEAFRQLAADQHRFAQGEQPIRRFVEGLKVLLDQSQLILQPKNSAAKLKKHSKQKAIVGYENADFYILPPDVTYGAVRRLSGDIGEAFPVPRNRLFKDIRDERISECDGDRTLKVVNLGGERRRMLVLRRDAVDELLGLPLLPR